MSRPMKATLPVALMRPQSRPTADSPPRLNTADVKTLGGYSEQRITSPAASPVSSKEKQQIKTSKSNISGQSSTSFASSLSSNSGGGSSGGGGSNNSALSGGGASYIRRTGSLDTLYLAATGNATSAVSTSLAAASSREAASLLSLYGGYCGRLMVDRATQTPEEWEDYDRKKGHQRKISDGLEMKYIRQRLQRSTQLSRGGSNGGGGGQHSSGGPSPQPASVPPTQILPRYSPVQGGSALSAHYSTSISTSSASTSHSTAATPLGGTSSSSPSMYQQPHHFLPGHTGPPLITTQQHSPSSAYGASAGLASAYFNQSSAAPIPIPNIPKPLIPRMRSSVEGLNQEIEKLVLRGISGNDAEGETERAREPTPDGHRAPIAKLFRTNNSKGGSGGSISSSSATSTVDTQTPSTVQSGAIVFGTLGDRPSSHQSARSGSSGGAPDVFLGLTGDDGSGGSSAATSRSQSVSPSGPIIPGSMDNSRPPSSDGRKSASPEDSDHLEDCKFGTSPQINKFLAREPPDGCEKIKLVEEPHQMCPLVVEPCIGRGSALINSGSGSGVGSGTGNIVLRPSVNFVLMPSQSSAFHPLYKPYLPPSNAAAVSQSSSSSPSDASGGGGGGSVNSSAFLSLAVVNRGATPPNSRSPLNERLQ